MEQTQTCRKCLTTKPLDDFYFLKKLNRLNYYCKECISTIQREQRNTKPIREKNTFTSFVRPEFRNTIIRCFGESINIENITHNQINKLVKEFDFIFKDLQKTKDYINEYNRNK